MLEAGLCPNLTQGIIDGKYDVAVLLDRLQTSSSLQVIPIRRKHGYDCFAFSFLVKKQRCNGRV